MIKHRRYFERKKSQFLKNHTEGDEKKEKASGRRLQGIWWKYTFHPFRLRKKVDLMAAQMVSHPFKKHQEGIGVLDRLRPSAPRKLTRREERNLARESRKKPELTTNEILSTTKLIGKVSVETAKRSLRRSGLFGRIAVRKPRLTVKQKANRQKWCAARRECGPWRTGRRLFFPMNVGLNWSLNNAITSADRLDKHIMLNTSPKHRNSAQLSWFGEAAVVTVSESCSSATEMSMPMDTKAFSMKHSPFASIQALTEYVAGLLESSADGWDSGDDRDRFQPWDRASSRRVLLRGGLPSVRL